MDKITQCESGVQKEKKLNSYLRNLKMLGSGRTSMQRSLKRVSKRFIRKTRKAWYHDIECFDKESQLDPTQMKGHTR